MNENQIRFAIGAGLMTVAVTLTVRSSIKTHREEAKKREQIAKDFDLDIAAIKAAHNVMIHRIENGEIRIRTLQDLADALNTEIKFQKIAIREA